MLIRFSLENWMSFRDRVTFSMIASRERQHSDRITRLDRYQTRILPVAAIYGGNASGKTNFFRALGFAKTLIVNGTQPDTRIPVEPFLLGAAGEDGHPSHFTFELLVHDRMFEFSFSVTAASVLEEKLTSISSSSEKVLYHRREGTLKLHDSLSGDKFLEFAFRGTRDNQLFLTNAVSQKVDTFRPVYDWFRDSLVLIAPDSRFASFDEFLDEGSPLHERVPYLLSQLDTGILRLGAEELPLEHLHLPEQLLLRMKKEIREGMTVRLMTEPYRDRILVTRRNGVLVAKKLETYRRRSDGTEISFDIRQESDGTKRLIDLLPAFLQLMTSGAEKVFVIDEVDRSLHPLLLRKLLELYLAGCGSGARTQLLMTTHDALLMDQQLLRRDEMWVTERNADGVSHLLSFNEFKDIRYDKDIRKSYLQGRLGGVPRLLISSPAPDLYLAEKNRNEA